eukprot:TRINITY_DN1413_c0_g1_i5.p1 TRINITY_DN1413_c0_g1~~TRINITY_DN1413_c0_g1_i5.p1  ORF type:complete len:567 (+),score=80.20 TRINITY_DN1413_c0_g1_i5:163-1863(+)
MMEEESERNFERPSKFLREEIFTTRKEIVYSSNAPGTTVQNTSRNEHRSNSPYQPKQSKMVKSMLKETNYTMLKKGNVYCEVCNQLQQVCLYIDCGQHPLQQHKDTRIKAKEVISKVKQIENDYGHALEAPKNSRNVFLVPKTKAQKGSKRYERTICNTQPFEYVPSYKIRYDELQRLLEITESDLFSCQITVKELQKKFEKASVTNESLREDLIRLREELSKTLAQNREYALSTAIQLGENNVSLGQLRDFIKELLNFIKTLEPLMGSHSKEKYNSLLSTIESYFRTIQDRVSKNTPQIIMSQRLVDEMTGIHQKYNESSILESKTKLHDDEEEVEVLGQEGARRDESINLLKKQIQDYQDYIEKYLKKADEAGASNEGVRGALKRILHLQTENDQLRKQNMQCQEKILSLQHEFESVSLKLSNVLKESEVKPMIVVEGVTTREESKQEEASNNMSIREQTHRLEQELASHKNFVFALQREIAELEREKGNMSRDLQQRDDQIRLLMAQINQTQAVLEEKEEEIMRARDSFSIEKSNLSEQMERIASEDKCQLMVTAFSWSHKLI